MNIATLLLEVYLLITTGAIIFDLSRGRFMGRKFPIDELGPWFLLFIVLAGFAWLPILIGIGTWKLLCWMGQIIDAVDEVEVVGASDRKFN